MEQFLKQLKDNWVILIFIGMLIVSWTNQNARLVAAEKDINDLKVVAAQINQIQISIAVIQEKITNIDAKIQ